jgi:hypothetical protein
VDFVRYGRVDAAAALESFPGGSSSSPAPATSPSPAPAPRPAGDVAPAISVLVPGQVRVGHRDGQLAFAVIASAPGKLRVELSGGGVNQVLGLRTGSNRLSVRLPAGVRPGVHVLTLTSTSSGGVSGTSVQRRVRFYR